MSFNPPPPLMTIAGRFPSFLTDAGRPLRFLLGCLFLLYLPATQAQTLDWAGCTWILKDDQAAGPGPNDWNPRNVFVDTNGDLHLKITFNRASHKWDCAELFTTNNFGFGTYQWQIETRVDRYDPWVVLGLFPYGPPALGPDGSNEIDIEYALWGRPHGDNGGWTIYPDSGTNIGHYGFTFNLDRQPSLRTTSRFIWSATDINYSLLDGFQSPSSTNNLIAAWDYAPPNPAVNVPQRPMPLHLNFWLDRGHVPVNGRPDEVIIHRLDTP